MARVTVEGTITPSTFLARGARITVERTSYIDKLIRNGFVKVVASSPVFQEAVLEEVVKLVEDQRTTVPPVTAFKSEWATFLHEQDVHYPEGATKTEMIAAWRALTGWTDEDAPIDG